MPRSTSTGVATFNRSGGHELEAGCDVDAGADAAIDRAPRCVVLMGAPRRILLVGWTTFQPVANPNSLDDEHTIVDLDVAFGV
jgi:hypothetical protein